MKTHEIIDIDNRDVYVNTFFHDTVNHEKISSLEAQMLAESIILQHLAIGIKKLSVKDRFQ